MDDLGAAVSSFLSQPGAMDQLRSMAEQLGLDTGGGPSEPSGGADQPSSGGGPEHAGGGEPLVSPETLQKMMSALSAASRPDETTAFLEALRPLLKPDRQGKLDRAIRAVRLTRAAQTVTSTLEL